MMKKYSYVQVSHNIIVVALSTFNVNLNKSIYALSTLEWSTAGVKEAIRNCFT